MTPGGARAIFAATMNQRSQPSIDFLFSMMGEAKITAMVEAFYRRIPGDPLLGPMYPAEDLLGAEERLRDFLIMRLGGPQKYLEQRGHPRLRMRHAPFSIGIAERDRWLELMESAMDETGVEPAHAEILRPFFRQIADFMRNRREGE